MTKEQEAIETLRAWCRRFLEVSDSDIDHPLTMNPADEPQQLYEAFGRYLESAGFNRTTGKWNYDEVDHPPHYNAHPSGIECMDIVEVLPAALFNAVKYAWRSGEKHATPVMDLRKADWYLTRFIDHIPFGPENWIHYVGRVVGAAPNDLASRLLAQLYSFFHCDPESRLILARNARNELYREFDKLGIER